MPFLSRDSSPPTIPDDRRRSRRGFRIRAHRRRRRQRRWVAWVAAAVALALGFGGAVVAAPAASAATKGAGFGTWSATSAYGWHGAMMIDGVATYCISPGLPAPVGPSTKVGVTGSVPGLTATQLTRINLLVSKYGQTRDNARAAAVAWAVKAIADWNTTLHEYGYRGNSLAGAINWTFSALSPTNNASVQRLATAYYREAMATPAGVVAGSGALAFTVDRANDYLGTVRAAAPAGSTGTIQLVNGRFVDNGTNRLAGAVAGAEYRITGVPPRDDGAPYEISGTGRFAGGYAAAVTLFRTRGQQSTAGPGGSKAFTVSGKDRRPRSVTFQPVLTSRTAKITPDGRLTDTLEFATAANRDGVANPWYRRADGTLAEVRFTVTAYGPLDRRPAETSEVPVGAPVADVARVSTGRTGDTAPVTAVFAKLQPAGIYTFVAEYDDERTPAATRALLPAGYRWRHAFGIADETTFVPMRVRLSSRISTPTTPLSGTDDDVVTVAHDGAWLTDAGAPIAVVLRGQYVHLPAGAPSAPSDGLPPGARVLGEVTLTVSGDGDYRASTSGDLPRNPAVPADAGAADGGRMTWRWAIRAVDQPAVHRGWVRETAEQYGVESQTSSVELPTVTTKAQAGYSSGGSVRDTALVRGTLPTGGAELAFSAYRVPMTKDGSGRWTVAAPGGTVPGDLSWVCTKENLVFSDVGRGRRVTAPGDYESPAVEPPAHAKILWVETLRTIPRDGRPVQTIRAGHCGDAQETSFGVDVTTRAATTTGGKEVLPGARVFDTAAATGYVPEGGRIAFRVYAWPTGERPTCTDATLRTTLRATTGALTGGLYPRGGELVVESERWVVPPSSSGTTLGFVEVLTDRAGRVIRTGSCGATSETISVVAGPRVNTGGTVAPADGATPPALWALAALAASAVALVGAAAIAGSRQRMAR